MNADIIFVVSDGEIVEKGSHEELLEKKGKYSELWSKQIFVKPKELKNDSTFNGTDTQTGDASPTDELVHKPTSQSTLSEASNTDIGTQPMVATTSVNKSSAACKDDRQPSIPKLVTTPTRPSSGHKKEVDQSKNP